MNGAPKPGVIENPFSTRFVQPGELSFLFAESDRSIADLARQLMALGAASIVGPHGVGKSTLCHSLKRWFVENGWSVDWIQLRSDRRWSPDTGFGESWDAATLVVVDGFEQLSAWHRWRLVRLAKRREATLITTVHRKPNLPVLLAMTPTLPVIELIVAKLLDDDWSVVTRQDVASCFRKHGDARETLFALYDIYQARI